MARMHVDELEIDEALVRRLLGEQFPEWVDLPLRRIEPTGTDSAIFRRGDELSARLARREGPTQPGGKEPRRRGRRRPTTELTHRRK
jgi:aminoglycoside phosphotransferase (APT) family kinase protein